jgi:hypothetical protein
MKAMEQGFTMALRQGNAWLLEYHGNNSEIRRVSASLSDENVARLSDLFVGGLNQEQMNPWACRGLHGKCADARPRGRLRDL